MTNLQFSLATAHELLNSGEQYPVNFDDAWIWLGYSKKDKALDTLKSYFDEGLDYAFLQKGEWSQDGRSSDLYGMTVDCFKEMGMLAKTDKGKQIRRYFLECEKLAKAQQPVITLEMFNVLLTEVQRQNQQLRVLEVDHERLNQLQAEKDKLTQEREELHTASQIHPGCAEIIADQIDNEDGSTLMTARDFVTETGIAPNLERSIVLLANGYQKCGKSNKKSPKQQGTNRIMIELRYLKKAARLVLGL